MRRRCWAKRRERETDTGCTWKKRNFTPTIEQLREAGARILLVAQIKASLEEYFMHLVEADRAQAAAVEVSGK